MHHPWGCGGVNVGIAQLILVMCSSKCPSSSKFTVNCNISGFYFIILAFLATVNMQNESSVDLILGLINLIWDTWTWWNVCWYWCVYSENFMWSYVHHRYIITVTTFWVIVQQTTVKCVKWPLIHINLCEPAPETQRVVRVVIILHKHIITHIL